MSSHLIYKATSLLQFSLISTISIEIKEKKLIMRSKSKFMSYMKCPFRALARARDLYVESLSSGGVTYGNAMGCPTPHIPSSLPRSVSASSALVRTADHRARKAEAELRRTRSSVPLGGGGVAPAAVQRSKTVAYGRIEEDKEFKFGDDDRIGLLGEVVYSRSRSYAPSKRVKLHQPWTFCLFYFIFLRKIVCCMFLYLIFPIIIVYEVGKLLFVIWCLIACRCGICYSVRSL